MTSVTCFRIWGHFPPFRVLGFGVIFHRSMFKDLRAFSAVPCFTIWGHFPPFHHSAVPPFRLLGSPVIMRTACFPEISY